MTTAAIREKLHDFINNADDKQVTAVFTLIENEVVRKSELIAGISKAEKMHLMKEALNDPLFLADLKEISDDFDVVDRENL